MVSLADAYNGYMEETPNIEEFNKQPPPQQHQQQPQPQPQPQQQHQPLQQQQQQVQIQENFNNYNIQQQPPYKIKNNNYNYSFWDRMILSRSDVIKLAVFSVVILLGISLDRLFTHYLVKYLNENIFTTLQELLIRISYPVLLFLILWIIKSL